jgi:hypothetical protein
MNNARTDMFHDLVCEHRKLSDAHSKLRLELSPKGKSADISIYAGCFALFASQYTSSWHIFIYRHITFNRHSAAGAEARITTLLKRVKELTVMPVSADLLLLHVYFKSFNSCHCFLSSTSLELQIFAAEKAALEARHQDCTPSVDVAKQLDDRDATHKAEVEQLKGWIAELLEEKEQSEGQLKKAQDLLVTSEADASSTHAELDGLKEQATK